jgi:hypothetical protein
MTDTFAHHALYFLHSIQDPDDEWRLISIRSRDQRVEGFIDGLHGSPKPPLLFENEEIFESIQQFRVGLLDEPGSARSGFLNGLALMLFGWFLS